MAPLLPAVPYPGYLLALVRRASLIWLLVRLMYIVVLLVASHFFGLLSPEDAMASAREPAFAARGLLIAITAFLVWLGQKRSGELLLQANLGTSPTWCWATSAFTAAGLDLATQWVS